MDTETTELTVLIANVSNSIGLYEKLGDITAHAKIKACQDTLTTVTEDNHGKVVKRVGDKILCIFPATAAIKMHKVLKEGSTEKDEVRDVKLSIHVGMHYGQTMVAGENNVFGSAVNIASQLANQARSDQIFTTRSTIGLLAPDRQESSHYIESTSIKGVKEKIDMYEITWQGKLH